MCTYAQVGELGKIKRKRYVQISICIWAHYASLNVQFHGIIIKIENYVTISGECYVDEISLSSRKTLSRTANSRASARTVFSEQFSTLLYPPELSNFRKL